ncbi:MAG TPA: histidine kinase N-terminal 7TM domain-containing protein [Chloroflexota bacterium]
MNAQVAPYLLVLLLTDAAAIGLALHAWRRRPSPGAGWFALFVLTGAVGLTAYAGELLSPDPGAHLFWNKVEYFGWAPMHAAWFLFALAYTGREGWLANWRRVCPFVVPAATLAFVWTNEAHGLIWRSYAVDATTRFAGALVTHGPWFWVHVANAYGLYLAGLTLLVRELARRGGLYLGQSLGLAVGTVVPFVANVVYLSGSWPVPGLDPTPFAFALSALAFGWALFRERLLAIVPLAHGAVIRGMDDPVFVVDAAGRIADMNPAAERIAGWSAADAVGRSAAEVMAARTDLVERFWHAADAHAEIELGPTDRRRVFDLRISALRGRGGQLQGRVVALRDVTDRKRAEDERVRLVEEQAARAALEAFLDAASDAVLVFGVGGHLLRANRAAREWIEPLLGDAAPTADALLRAARPRRPDGTVPTTAFLDRALRGERVSEEVVWRRPDGADRRLHAVAVPVREAAGRAWAAVVVARDITELHAAIAERGRLDGAVKTARLVAHELNNKLALLTGYGELLPRASPADARRFAEKLLEGALEAAAIVARLQRIVRFEETEADQPMLDLDAATRPAPGAAPPE